MSNENIKDAWTKVGDELSDLGLKLKYHVRQEFSDETNDEVKSALKRLGEAVEDTVQAVGNAAKDEAVRQDVKQTGKQLLDALSTTFEEARKGLKNINKQD
jgi:ElaB/YqjD/DUF883 family membrane-anchored ribosome-binding protein